MTQARKVGIVGVGHVGAHVANSLILQGLVDELYLCDSNEGKSACEAQDLNDSVYFCPFNVKIIDCGSRYEELADCDIIVNSAGKVALVKENRDGELPFTSEAVKTFVEPITKAGFKGIWLNIANPCDVITTMILKLSGADSQRVLGTGTALDSARLKYQLKKLTNIDPKSMSAYMIGEHGASMLAAWSQITFGGKPLKELAKEEPEAFGFDKATVQQAAYDGAFITYRGKECTEYAIANAAARIIAAIFHDEHAIMGASALLTGQYGEEGICTSLPCMLGREGLERIFAFDLDEEETEDFHKSCDHIRENLAKVGMLD